MKPTVLTKDFMVVASKTQVSCDMAGEAAILDMKSGEYFGLNPVGARVWNLIQEPRRIGDLVEVLVNEYEVAPERCEQDLLDLIDRLVAKGLVEAKAGLDQGVKS